MKRKLGELIREDVASELIIHSDRYIAHADAIETLHFFGDDVKYALRFLKECYDPNEGDLVLQLAIYGNNIRSVEEGIAHLDSEDTELVEMDEDRLERIAERR